MHTQHPLAAAILILEDLQPAAIRVFARSSGFYTLRRKPVRFPHY
jgi:hypothetical protein